MAETPKPGDESAAGELRHISDSLTHPDLLRSVSTEGTNIAGQPETVDQSPLGEKQATEESPEYLEDESAGNTGRQQQENDLLWQEARGDRQLYELLAERRRIRDKKQELLDKPGYEAQTGLDSTDDAIDEVESKIRARLFGIGLRRDTIHTRLGKQTEDPPAS